MEKEHEEDNLVALERKLKESREKRDHYEDEYVSTLVEILITDLKEDILQRYNYPENWDLDTINYFFSEYNITDDSIKNKVMEKINLL